MVIFCCLVEMAYLTGQRASDLLRMEWAEIGKQGILFQPGKTLESTGVEVLIGWTPRLERLVARLRAESEDIAPQLAEADEAITQLTRERDEAGAPAREPRRGLHQGLLDGRAQDPPEKPSRRSRF